MTYQTDKLYDDPEDFVQYLLHDTNFRTSDRFSANSTGKNWFIFRGHSDAEWRLFPSAFRPNALSEFTPQPPHDDLPGVNRLRRLGAHLHAEARALYIFMESADAMGLPTPLDYTATTKGLELILAAFNGDEEYDYSEAYPGDVFQRATAFAQHYGVPTRYLDWSESPLVAAYFAAYGASSFAEEAPREGQELSVIFINTVNLDRDDNPVEVIKAPRHENSHLLRQEGIFTCIKDANKYFREKGCWPSFCDYSPKHIRLHRIRLKATHADELLRILFDLGIARHTLMPTLRHAAQSYAYAKKLFR